MSRPARDHVWEHGIRAGLTPLGNYVMLALAEYADPEGRNIYPSLDTIARKTGLSRRTIWGLLRTAVDAGFLAIEDDRRHRPKVYAFPGVRGAPLAPLNQVSRGASGASRGANDDTQGVQTTTRRGAALAPEPGYEPVYEPEGEPARVRANGPPPTQQAQKTTIDETWMPSADTLAWAAKQGITESDVEAERMQFTLKRRGRRMTPDEWQADFQAWLVNPVATDRRSRRAQQGNGRDPGPAERRPATPEYQPDPPTSMTPEGQAAAAEWHANRRQRR